MCRFKVDGEHINIGKPYVVLVFDRTSKKCVGWHVYLGNENWKEGYRLALFCAMTSKRERLNWLKIDAPQAWPDEENIRPSFIYVDGGPGASKAGRAAMGRLRIDFHQAPPDTPYWKPAAESGLGRQQSEQAHLDGGYERTNNAVEKDARRIAKLHARTTLWAFERELVKNIIAYNATFQKGMRLPAQLKEEAGPDRTPDAYYSAGVARIGGVEHRRLNEADVYESLLTHSTVFATVDGIRHLRGRYNSARLRLRVQVSGPGKIVVFYDPLRPAKLYWRLPDGVLDVLMRDHASEDENGLASAHDIDRYEEGMKALYIKKERTKSRYTKLSTRQRDIGLQAAGDRKPVRKSVSKHQGFARDLEAQDDLNTREYDRAEKYLEPETVQTAAGPSAKPAAEKQTPGVRDAQTAEKANRNKEFSARATRLAELNRSLEESDE